MTIHLASTRNIGKNSDGGDAAPMTSGMALKIFNHKGMARQPLYGHADFDEHHLPRLQAEVNAARPILAEFSLKIARQIGADATIGCRMTPKLESRIIPKTARKYFNDFSFNCDLTATRILLSDIGAAKTAIDLFGDSSDEPRRIELDDGTPLILSKVENFLTRENTERCGLPDLHVNVAIDIGGHTPGERMHVGEIQFRPSQAQEDIELSGLAYDIQKEALTIKQDLVQAYQNPRNRHARGGIAEEISSWRHVARQAGVEREFHNAQARLKTSWLTAMLGYQPQGAKIQARGLAAAPADAISCGSFPLVA